MLDIKFLNNDVELWKYSLFTSSFRIKMAI